MKKNISYVSTLIIFCILPIIFCTEWKNPYLDNNNSKVVITTLGHKSGDTLEIFSKDSFSVQVYLREYVSKYSISSKKNRYWHDSTIRDFSGNLRFSYSFYDTGWQEINITSYMTSGDSSISTIKYYVKSPLKQNTLEITAGTSIALSTTPVKDKDYIMYVWDLHDRVIKDFNPTTSQFIDKAPSSSVGEVYVIDINGNRSPSSFFIIKSTQAVTSQVTISSANVSVLKDTIYSKTPSIVAIINVAGVTSIKEFSINNIVDSHSIKNPDGSYQYYKTINNLDSVSPVQLIIKVIDNSNKTTIDTLYVKYTETTTIATPVIAIQNPSKDSTSSNNQNLNVYGQVSNGTRYQSGTMFCYNNGNLQPTKVTLTANSFILPVVLDNGRNELVLKFQENSSVQSTVLASKSIIVMYVPMSKDTVAPKIVLVMSGSVKLEDSTLFRTSTIPLTIYATDNNSIASVTVNGLPATISKDNISYMLNTTLVHPVNTLLIKATDVAGLSTEIVYRKIAYNHKPTISVSLNKTNLMVDSTYKIKAKVSDLDNDTLSVTALVNGTLVPIASDSTFTWKPALKDTGWQDIKFQVYDKYETSDTSVRVNISKAPNADIPVQWVTNGSHVRDTYYVGIDTLKMALTKNPLSNLPPFTYKVELVDIQKTIYSSTDSNLVWIPQDSDVGTHQIRFTISDNKGNKNEFTDGVVIARVVAGIRFEKSSGSCSESDGTSQINVLLSRRLNTSVTVNYAIDATQTTATVSDYSLSDGTLIFNPGDSIKTITVNITNDSDAELDEKVGIKLSNPSSNGNIETPSTTSLTILDDDYAKYSFTTSQDNGNSSKNNISITVKLSQQLSTNVVVNFKVDQHYTNAYSNEYYFSPQSQNLIFSAFETEKTFTLTFTQQALNTISDKIVGIRLSSSSPNLRAGDIVLFKYTLNGSNSNPILIYANNPSIFANELDTTVNFTFTRTTTTLQNVNIAFAINKEFTTADSGKDFIFVSQNPISINWSNTSTNLFVKILNDTIAEEAEKIVIDITKISSGFKMSTEPTRLELTIQRNDY